MPDEPADDDPPSQPVRFGRVLDEALAHPRFSLLAMLTGLAYLFCDLPIWYRVALAVTFVLSFFWLGWTRLPSALRSQLIGRLLYWPSFMAAVMTILTATLAAICRQDF